MSKKIYLDHAATTPLDPLVLAKMLPYFTERFGNASSLHQPGQRAKAGLEMAREKVAKALNCQPSEIYFTSGGSESDNWALRGVMEQSSHGHLITTKIEHKAVLDSAKDLAKQKHQVTFLGVDRQGIIRLAELRKAIRPDTRLISVMYANNEVGSIQPVYQIGKLARKKGILFHVDAVQAAGSLSLDVRKINCDLMSLSGHKFYGPKGVGVLYIKEGVKIDPLIIGGGQEDGKRAGTENVAGIVGLAEALDKAEKHRQKERIRLEKLRDYFIRQLVKAIPSCQITGHLRKRLPNNVSCLVKNVEGESLLMRLDMEGIFCSTGSACTSRTLSPSHVLLAMGVSPVDAHGSLRFTMGHKTKKNDIDYVLKVLPEIVKDLRAMSPLEKVQEITKVKTKIGCDQNG